MLPVRRGDLAPTVATGFEAYVATQVQEARFTKKEEKWKLGFTSSDPGTIRLLCL